MKKLRIGTDNLVELTGPVNQAAKTPITAGTCYARLFDDRKDTSVAVAVSSGTSLTVNDSRNWAVGMQCLVWLDNATWHDGGLVTNVNASTHVLTLTNAIPSAAGIGNRVSAALGNGTANSYRITMAYFQDSTPIRGKYDYGFRGTIPDTHPGLKIGMVVRLEVELDAGAGLRVTETGTTVVAGGS